MNTFIKHHLDLRQVPQEELILAFYASGRWPMRLASNRSLCYVVLTCHAQFSELFLADVMDFIEKKPCQCYSSVYEILSCQISELQSNTKSKSIPLFPPNKGASLGKAITFTMPLYDPSYDF